MSEKTRAEEVTLTFDLHGLPTAQHRAGLAGLVLQIDAMGPEGYRTDARLVPVIEELSATSAKIAFTRESMQGVFDELYAAKLVERVVASRWPGEAKPKPGEFHVEKKDPKTGQVKKVPGFAYDVVQPQAPALMRHLRGNGEAWLELWRQMLWAIPRGGNNVRSRAPFIDVADGRPCGEGTTAWTQLVDFRERLAKSQFKTGPISGALMLGAQAVNAEGVPFSGRVDHNLLLHFWQLVVLTFVPQAVNKKDAKVERIGYVLAIPDVADLVEFRHEFPEILQGLKAEDPKHTPPKARLDLPEQAGLEVLRRLREERKEGAGSESNEGPDGGQSAERLPRHGASDRVDRRGAHQALAAGRAAREWGHCIRAVESFHMFKLGNNVKLLSFSRVADRPGLVEEYERIDKTFRNPLFRAARMRALLHRRPWHWGMTELFSEYPWTFFIEGDGSPKYLPRFGRDARELFNAHQQEVRDVTFDDMDHDDKLKSLGVLVRRLIASYVDRRAAAKMGLKYDELKVEVVDGKKRRIFDDPEKYRENQRRVCSDTFLQLRSRHDEDFVEYFAGSICSVPQFFDEKKAGELSSLMAVLMRRPSPNPVAQSPPNRDDIKTLAMVALSSHSFLVRKRDAQPEGSHS